MYVCSERTTSVPERPEPQSLTSNKQKKKGPGTVQTTQDSTSRIGQNTKRSDEETAKTTRVEITPPLDTFTLHETVKRLLENKETISPFTLHRTVKYLTDKEKKSAGPGSKQKDANIKVVVVPPRSRRTSGDDGQTASGAPSKQSSAGPAERQSKNKADKSSALAQKEDYVVKPKDSVKTKLSTVSADDVPSHAEEKHKSIRIVIQPPDESKISEKEAAGLKAKKKLRFELVEDLPSPINPTDQQMSFPSSSIQQQPDNLPQQELCSVTSVSDLLSPSPIPSEELPLELDSAAMRSLRRLFPTIGSLVRVTLVPPRRQSHRRLEHSVEEDIDDGSLTSDLDEEEESTGSHLSKGSLSEQDVDEMKMMDGTEEEWKPERRLLLSLSRNTEPRTAPTTDLSSVDAADQLPSLPRTQSSARPKPDDAVSEAASSMSSSTALPMDVTEAASRHLSDVQVSMNKTLTQIVARVLPPNKSRVEQSVTQKAPANNDDVKETATVVTNRGTEKDSTSAVDLPIQRDSIISVCESVKSVNSVTDSGRAVHHPALRCKPGPIQLGITGDDVDDIVRATSPSSTASLERDIGDRATTIVSGIVQSLRATSSITGH